MTALPRFLLVPLTILTQTALGQVSVLTQHNNLKRTGWNDQETHLAHENVNKDSFGLISSLAVDDEIYAQPLLLSKLTIGSFTGQVAFVVTVNNTLYAFNADDPSQPAPLWQLSLNPSGQRAPNIFDLQDPVNGKPCGGNYRDFSGRVGTVGTPVIDSASNTLYIACKTIDNNGTFTGYINAIDIRTGLHKAGSPHKIIASINGNGAGSNNGVINYDAKYQNQRPALLLYNNIVYVASASHCDWGPYHGWILGFDANTLDLKYSYNSTPNGWAGGIWMAGEGISVGDDGNLYVVTGNGTTGGDNNDLSGGRSESLIKLSPQLQMQDWYTPINYDYLDSLDLDYGCDGALIIPNSSITISGSKEGLSYVVDYNKMGRLTSGNTQVLDTLEFNPQKQGFVHVHGSPVYAKLETGEYVYAWAETFKIRQFEFDRANSKFLNVFKEGNRNLDNGMPGAMLSISSNNQDTASGIVWACFPTSGNANNQVRPGTIAAYRANDVSTGELWNSNLNSQDDLGKFAKFNSPTVANGRVYAPTFSNSLKIYGLKCASSTGLVYADGNGLKAEYFTGSTGLNFPDASTLTRLDKGINFNWGTTNPAPGVSATNFKVRWAGKIRPLTSENYTFYITANDGVRLWINNTLIIDSWTDNSVQTHSGSIQLQKNSDYDIKVEYFSHAGPSLCVLQWSATGVCKQTIPAAQLFAPVASCVGTGTGLKAEYFSNAVTNAPFPDAATLTNTAPHVDYDWGGGAPAGISTDHFKARFSGYIQSTDEGVYTFYVTADDGVRLWVNNNLIIDKWVNQPATEYQATINLAGCSQYPIRLEYYENGGDAVCKLQWSGPLTDRQSIPTSQLFTDAKPSGALSLYPNPTLGDITITSKDAFNEGDLVVIYDMLGRKMKTFRLSSADAGKFKIDLSLGQLASGLYAAHIESKKAKANIKFLKK